MKQYRRFSFNDSMDKDLTDIKSFFKNTFKVEPSNHDILSLLMKTYKSAKVDIKRKPRRKKEFVVKF